MTTPPGSRLALPTDGQPRFNHQVVSFAPRHGGFSEFKSRQWDITC